MDSGQIGTAIKGNKKSDTDTVSLCASAFLVVPVQVKQREKAADGNVL